MFEAGDYTMLVLGAFPLCYFERKLRGFEEQASQYVEASCLQL